MAAADPGTMFSMLGVEMEAEAGLYCLGQDIRPTTSLLLMLLRSAASAAPQFTRDTKSFTDTFMAADQSAAAVRASVVEKCDDLAQEKVAAGAASSRGAALPSLSPTEVYTRAA